MFSPKKILVPSDFSESSDNALKEAVDIAEKFGSSIVLLHVISSDMVQCADHYCLSADLMQQIEEDSIRASRQRLEKAVNAIIASRGIEIVFDIQRGVPSETILAEQKRVGADLIVIASHGRTGLKKLLLGSVAEKVVRNAECQVMVVK